MDTLQKGSEGFRRLFRLRDLVLFGITFVGPTAPFSAFGIVSSVSRGHMALCYLIALVAMVLTAASYGRMATAFPVAGSAYSYARRGLHPVAGFFAGWTMLMDYVLIPLLSVIYISLTLGRLLPHVPYAVWLVVTALAITAANLFGLRITNRANFVMTAIMSAALAWFVLAAVNALAGGAGAATLLSTAPFYDPRHFSMSAVMAGTSIAAYSYLGFDGISTLAEDARNPRRDISRATVLVCLIAAALFIVQVYLGQLLWPDYTSYPNTDTAFLDVSRRAGGVALFSGVSFVLLVAGFASAVAGQASASRLLYGMGRDHVLPARIFTYIHPKHSTPTYGVLTLGIASILGGFFLTYQLAAEAVNFGALIGFMGVNLSVIRHYYIRGRQRGAAGTVRNLVLPAAGFLVCLYVFANLSILARWIGVVWCGVGLISLVWLTRGFRRDLDALIPEEVTVAEGL